jgi:hypothetical protein
MNIDACQYFKREPRSSGGGRDIKIYSSLAPLAIPCIPQLKPDVVVDVAKMDVPANVRGFKELYPLSGCAGLSVR